MAQQDPETEDRQRHPIEYDFPIERINDIAEKEGRAKRHYRPIYTMHKWWARRLGCVFRSIALYTLVDDPDSITVREPGGQDTLEQYGMENAEIERIIDNVKIGAPDSLWELYSKDVTVEDKKVLDPFMGGGTSLVEASRFGAETVGYDLNPVAWFVTKKELEAGRTDREELEAAFAAVEDAVTDELSEYYKTDCPACDRQADVMYYFWVKDLDCVSCGETVPLFSDYRVAKGRFENDGQYNVFCPECEQLTLVDDWQSESHCDHCDYRFTPKTGTVHRGSYSCTHCGQKYGVTDAVQEQDGYQTRLYALEYYCPHCDEESRPKNEIKGYKAVDQTDIERYEQAAAEWEEADELREYVPDESIPEGAITAASSISGNDIFRHGYEDWTDMFNSRQLFTLSTLLRAIDDVEDRNAREYLLLAFSDALRFNNTMIGYQASRNHINDLFQVNSFDPQHRPAEANLWGTKYGMGSFQKNWQMVLDGVEYAAAPTERYPDENGDMIETKPFQTPIGENATLNQGDMRLLLDENEYDAVITDPPYYDNIIYSEVADYFYVWQKLLLEDEYEGFDRDQTPRAESIVTNPYLDKTSEDFESDLHESFTVIHNALKRREAGADTDGILAFTYHHSDAESWGELLASLCEASFEVSATYPVSADLKKFISGDAVSFDIIVVARPAGDRAPISWQRLKPRIYDRARKTRDRLEENRQLSRGDIGVMEMGVCFREYSKHHGEVRRDGEIMDAKEVVDEIYGIIQEASEVGVIDVFVDLLNTDGPTFDDVVKLCRGTNAAPEELREMELFNTDDGFELGTYDNERRQLYIQERINDDTAESSDLDKLQFLRYLYDQDEDPDWYLNAWNVGESESLNELAERLATASNDDTYRRVLGEHNVLGY